VSLHAALLARAAAGRPVRVALAGAGKFGLMWLAQVPFTPGVHVAGVADLDPGRVREGLARAGWPAGRAGARSLEEALHDGTTHLTDDAGELIRAGPIDLLVEATGDPAAGIRHALLAARHGKSVVMVNVEADALAGPLLARRVREAGAVYSLASGDQPALVCELVDWARTSGFRVVAAGKGTRYLPGHHGVTPDTVWDAYGFPAAEALAQGLNARMFTSFVDGTKSAIEMAAVANATGLSAPEGGLGFHPCGAGHLARQLRPRAEGGLLAAAGQVEVVSSVERDGSPVADDLRWGVFVVFEAPTGYAQRCLGEYGVRAEGRFASLHRPFHLIGLELGTSVASVALRREATGAPQEWRADVVATAKRELAAGEVLDGEGGFRVYGKLSPARGAGGALPVGLARGTRLLAPVARGTAIRWSDVAIDEASEAVRVRRELELTFPPGLP
jgi:predicted homoserine dehydrogenase-like protein